MREKSEHSNKKRTTRPSPSVLGSCDRSRFLISKSLETELSWREKFLLYAHLVTCRSCRHYKQHLLIIQRMIRCYCSRHPQAGSSWQLSAEARERMKKLIQEKMRKPKTDQYSGIFFHPAFPVCSSQATAAIGRPRSALFNSPRFIHRYFLLLTPPDSDAGAPAVVSANF
jgi:Putative zinc-finger